MLPTTRRQPQPSSRRYSSGLVLEGSCRVSRCGLQVWVEIFLWSVYSICRKYLLGQIVMLCLGGQDFSLEEECILFRYLLGPCAHNVDLEIGDTKISWKFTGLVVFYLKYTLFFQEKNYHFFCKHPQNIIWIVVCIFVIFFGIAPIVVKSYSLCESISSMWSSLIRPCVSGLTKPPYPPLPKNA